VGRRDERRVVHELLSTRTSVPFVVHVQGMPGSGKTAFLDQLALDAAGLGYTVFAPARNLANDRRAAELAKRLVPVRRKTVVIADDWDALALEELRLIEQLERASGPLVFFVSARARPRSCFTSSNLFPDRFRVLELAGLEESDAVALLGAHKVALPEARRIHHLCGGLPAPMLLMAASMGRGGKGRQHELLEGSLVDPVRRLVGQVRDPLHIAALELVCLAGSLNERELRHGLETSPARTREVFEWLRGLTIVKPIVSGLVVHGLVRATVVADLLQRDPVHARACVERLLQAIAESLSWTGLPRRRAIDQLRALVASAPQDVVFADMFESGGPRIVRPRDRDLREAFALVEAQEGMIARETAERYVRYDPNCITVLQGAQNVDGVMVRVEWRGEDIPAPLVEPAVSMLVRALTERGELSPQKLIRTTRFFLSRSHGQMPCAELGALGAEITRGTLSANEGFITAQILERSAMLAWLPIVRTMNFAVLDAAAVEIDGRELVPCVADFTDLGAAFMNVVRLAWGLRPPPAASKESVPAASKESVPAASTESAPAADRERALPSRDDVEAEVTRALAHVRDLVWLRGARLGTWLFAEETDPRVRAARLQAWLLETIDSTESMRNGTLVLRALQASFHGTRSVDEAAVAAKMGVSTLKRYRKLGVERVIEIACDQLDAAGAQRSMA
jgi:hypothetical protein